MTWHFKHLIPIFVLYALTAACHNYWLFQNQHFWLIVTWLLMIEIARLDNRLVEEHCTFLTVLNLSADKIEKSSRKWGYLNSQFNSIIHFHHIKENIQNGIFGDRWIIRAAQSTIHNNPCGFCKWNRNPSPLTRIPIFRNLSIWGRSAKLCGLLISKSIVAFTGI